MMQSASCKLIGTADVTQIRTVLPPLLQAHGSCFDQVNLNCGCPSIQAGGAATYGASLMQQPAQTAALVQALRRVVSEKTNLEDDDDDKVEVSLKCRFWEYGKHPTKSFHPTKCTTHCTTMSHKPTRRVCNTW